MDSECPRGQSNNNNNEQTNIKLDCLLLADVGAEAANHTEDETVDGVIVDAQSSFVKDSKLAWIRCFAAFFLQVFIIGILHSFGVFFVALIAEFKSSKATTAWIGSAAYGITMALAPLGSASTNVLGVRATIMLGSAMCMVATFTSSFVQNVNMLFLTFSVIYGLGTALAYTPTMTIADDYFSKYLSVATGITVSGSSIGTLILNPTCQALEDLIGWRHLFRVLTLLCALSMLCGLPFAQRQRRRETPAERVRKSPVRRIVAELHLWKNKVYVVWVIGLTFVMLGYYIPYVHMVSHAMTLGIPAKKGAILIMVLGASTATGRIMFGKIIAFGILDRLHMHQLSMVVTGTAYLMLPLIKTFPGLLVYVICVGLVDGCFVVMMPLLTLTLAGVENKMVAWGYLVGVTSITYMLGPPIAGWIYDATGSYSPAFRMAGASILTGMVMMFLIPWAQKTAETVNDALSVAGDVDAHTIISLDGRSVIASLHDEPTETLAAWAAPTPRPTRGSVRSSLRGSINSLSSRAAQADWTRRDLRLRKTLSPQPSAAVTLNDIALEDSPLGRGGSVGAVHGLGSSDRRRTSEGIPVSNLQLPLNQKLVCATSLEEEQMPRVHRVGPRLRSVSESTYDRCIHWSDMVGAVHSPAITSNPVQADPLPQGEVEICDDFMGIFRETSHSTQTETLPVSVPGHMQDQQTSTRAHSPVFFEHGPRSSPDFEESGSSTVAWSSPVGSPTSSSPRQRMVSPNSSNAGFSPSCSSSLLPIPENQPLENKAGTTSAAGSCCRDAESPGTNASLPSQSRPVDPKEVEQMAAEGSPIPQTEQESKSESDISHQTNSTASVHISPTTSSSQVSPDAQPMFLIDVSEDNSDSCQDN